MDPGHKAGDDIVFGAVLNPARASGFLCAKNGHPNCRRLVYQ